MPSLRRNAIWVTRSIVGMTAAVMVFILTAMGMTLKPDEPHGVYLGLAILFAVFAVCCVDRKERRFVTGIVALAFLIAAVDRLWPGALESIANSIAIVYGLVVGGVVLFLVVVIAYVRWRDRLWNKALRTAQEGRTEEAVEMVQEHIKRNGPSAVAYNTLGLIYYQQEKWQEALDMFERAEDLGEKSPIVRANRGLMLWKLGRLDEALVLLKEAAQRLPHNFVIQCNYGTVLAEANRRDEAEAVLDQAERLLRKEARILAAADRRVRQDALDTFRRKVRPASP